MSNAHTPMNALQKATVLTLNRMIEQVKADEDDAGAYAGLIDNLLDELASNDFFGTEQSTDPRGDFRNGTWSCDEGRVES